ncbi:MAG: aspartate carbamoyltransferase, partial [Minisyncoccia bacterium]
MRHIISATDFTAEDIKRIFGRALEHKRGNGKGRLGGCVVASLFYEPSTRTRISFEMATLRGGGRIVSSEHAGIFSSAAKGETLEDTIRVIASYNPNVIVLRHKEAGAATRAAAVSSVPIINAGDGDNEHPTQALLDLFTIWEASRERRWPHASLRVSFFGDNRKSRTVRSLARLMLAMGNALGLDLGSLVFSGENLECAHPDGEFLRELENQEVVPFFLRPIREFDRNADIVYVTRFQKERYPDEGKLTDQSTEPFCVGLEHVRSLSEHAIIMHPLPRVDELSAEVDSDPRAWYFRQAENGLYVRMALLEMIIG